MSSSPLQPMAYITFIFVGLYTLRFLTADQQKGGWHYFAPLSVILLTGILLASVQLLPSAELFLLVRRGGAVSGRTIPQAILATVALVTFMFPGLGGQMKGGMLLAQAWGGETHSQGYIGFLPLLLALIAIFAWKDRRKRPLIILAMFCLIIVLYTPLRSFVYDRFLLVYIFAMSVLAAYGADALLEHRLDLRSLNRPLKIICGLVICVGVSVVAGSLVFWIFKETFLERSHRFLSQFIAGRFLGYHLPLHIQKLDFTIQSLMITSPRMLLPLLIAAGSIAVVYQSMKRRLSKKTIAFLIVIISASDLSYMAATHIPFVDLKKYPLFPKADLITPPPC